MRFIKGYAWGVLSLFTIFNIGMLYFNINMLKDQRHYSFIKTDRNCNFIDPQSADYIDMTAPANLPARKK